METRKIYSHFSAPEFSSTSFNDQQWFIVILKFIYLFIHIFGCAGSSLWCMGFLQSQ